MPTVGAINSGRPLFYEPLGSRVGEALVAVAAPRHDGMNAIDGAGFERASLRLEPVGETVSLETIDEIVARSGSRRLDLLKVDIEGSEVDALNGPRMVISGFRRITLLEVEAARLAGQAQTKEDLEQTLDQLGFELSVFDANSTQLLRGELPLEPEGNATAAPRRWRPSVLS